MSLEAMAKVWKESPRKGSALLLLLAIADYANEQGAAWPSVDTLAAKCRMSRRNVQVLCETLAKDGDISIDLNAGPNSCNIYRLSRISKDAVFAPAKTRAPKTAPGGANAGPQNAHKPSGTVSEPSGTSPAGADALGEHKSFIEGWHDEFPKFFGMAYVMHGGADGKAAKELLARSKLSASYLLAYAKAAWAKTGKQFWACENKSRSIREFASNFNKIASELHQRSANDIPQSAAPNLPRPAGKQPPAGLKPFSQRPPAKYDEDMKPITIEEWRERYPLRLYYDDRTLEPMEK